MVDAKTKGNVNLLLRIPECLHRDLQKASKEDFRSLNSYVLMAIKERLRGKE